jgi:DNA-binding MarR family transcriptional regulator
VSRAEVGAEELLVAVNHVNRVLRLMDAEVGLSPVRSEVLSVLAFHAPMSVGELARREGVASPSMTRLLVDMEKDGLLRRYPDPGDGRRLLAELTEAGRALIHRARNRKIALFAEQLEKSKVLRGGRSSALVEVLEGVASQR